MPRIEGLTLRPCDGTAQALIDGTPHRVELRRRSSGFRVVWPETRHPPSALKQIDKQIVHAAEQWLDLAGQWPAPDRRLPL